MKVLVTGGAGYIGSHTIVHLQQAGFEVICIDSHVRSKPDVIGRIAQITGVMPRHYPIDLCQKDELYKVLESEPGITGVIHFAALKSVPESVKEPLNYYHNNLNSLLNLLQAVNDFKIPHFVFSSSCTVYGNVLGAELPVTEDTPFKEAECPYGRTKQMGEQIISDFSKVSDAAFVMLRYFNPAGAHPSGIIGEDSTDVVTALVPRITGFASGRYESFTVFGTDYRTRDGSCVRDFIHVMDIAAAHTCALQYLQKQQISRKVEVFNLGTGNGVSVLEAIQSFERVSAIKLNYKIGDRRSGDVEAIYANNDKAREVLSWNPEYSLDDMMRTAWAWEQKLVQRKG